MRNFLLIVLVLSVGVIGVATEQVKETHKQSSSEPAETKRDEAEGLSEEARSVLDQFLDPNVQVDLLSEYESRLSGLPQDERNKLAGFLEERLKEPTRSTDEEGKLAKYQALRDLLKPDDKKEEEGSQLKPLDKSNSQLVLPNGKRGQIFKMAGGYEVYLDTQGRKAVNGEPLVVVGKEGATTMDGIFPASAFGLTVKDGQLFFDPKAQTTTVSTNNGPTINSMVPVIFNQKGEAFTRQSVKDAKGNQTSYWYENREIRTTTSQGNEVITGGELPAGLEVSVGDREHSAEVRKTAPTDYVNVSTAATEPTARTTFTLAGTMAQYENNRPQIPMPPPVRPVPAPSERLVAAAPPEDFPTGSRPAPSLSCTTGNCTVQAPPIHTSPHKPCPNGRCRR